MTCLLPQQSPLFVSLRRQKPAARPQISVSGTHWKEQRRLSAFACVSSSSVTENVEKEEEEDSPPLPSSLVDGDFDSDQVLLSSSGCKACGREEIERGCNGEGRIQGGIATVPGFGWWPIKAYRPCPGFLASGGNYRRRGQSMDEVAFGGGKRGTSMDDLDELEKRKKGTDRRKFKR